MILATDQEPRWLQVLREQCKGKSQKRVAEEIGYSPAVVNQVLGNKYKGDINKVEKAVRGAYLGDTVRCPVLGELPVNRCMEYQRQPFAATNPTRVQLYRACRKTCIHSKIGR